MNWIDKSIILHEIDDLFSLTVEQRTHVISVVDSLTESGKDFDYEEIYQKCNLSDAQVTGQPLETTNYTDGDDNPDGGHTEAPGLAIRWQRGPINPSSDALAWNGCFLVTVLEAAKQQLKFYQSTKFKSEANDEMLVKLQELIDLQNKRQVDRFRRGVRGQLKN